jgi:hypothetical protein
MSYENGACPVDKLRLAKRTVNSKIIPGAGTGGVDGRAGKHGIDEVGSPTALSLKRDQSEARNRNGLTVCRFEILTP